MSKEPPPSPTDLSGRSIMADAIKTTRRFFIKALPIIGAAAALPSAALGSMSLRERFDFHFQGLADCLNETAGACDGWNLQCGLNRGIGYHQAQRFWYLDESIPQTDRVMRTTLMREFSPLTGEDRGCGPLPDLRNWRQSPMGARS